MAILDPKKLLPPRTTGSALVKQKSISTAKFIPNSSSLVKPKDITPPETETGDLYSDAIVLQNKVLSIQKLIGNNTYFLKKSQEAKRKESENNKFEKKEQKLEEKKLKFGPGINLPSLPKTGFLDAIKRFLFYTFLGYAFNKFGKYIPKIIELTTKLTPVISFFEKFIGNVLNGVINFVDAGYDAYDKVRAITKSIGGKDAEKKFDEFGKQFNTFANLALIAGMATMGGKDVGFGNKKSTSPKSSKVSEIKKEIRTPTGTRKLPGTFTPKGYVPGDKITQYAPKNKNLFQRTSQQARILGKKGFGNFAGKALGRVPIIGGLIDFIISTVIFKENPGRAAAKAVGSTLGAALGTFIPVPLVGTILGGILGDIVGGALYDTLASKEPIQGKAKGGEVTRKGQKVQRPAVRKIRKIKTRPPKIKPQKTVPGKDIGGKEQISKLFPTTKDPKVRNPLGFLESTSTNLKSVPMIGGLLGASLDLAMGQKPEASVFNRIGMGFGSLIQSAIDAETNTTLNNIQKEVVALANGGVIPRTLSSGENIGMKIGERIAKTLEVMVNDKVNQTLQAIRKEFGKQDITGSTGPTGPTSTSGEIAEGTLARGQITIEQLVGLAKGAGFSQQDAVIMAAIAMAESGGNSNAHNNNRATGDNSYGLWQINMIDRLGPERLKQFGISNYEQLKDPVINAHAAKKTKERQGFTAWSVYKSGKYKTHLAAAQRAAGSPAITVYKPGTGGGGFIPLGSMNGSLSEVQRLAESMGVPLYSHIRKKDPKSYHYDGRAMDFSNDSVGNGTPQQLALAKELVKRYGSTAKEIFYTPLGFSIKDGKKVNLIAPDTHYNHVHVAFEKGGKVPGLTRAILGEKGPEFVLDNDTTTALEQNFPGFLDSLNKADYKGTLQVLQNYASYHNPSGTTLMMQRVIIEKPIPMQSKGGGFIPIDNSTSSSNSTAVLYKG